jgi:hypothetical protein
MWTAKHEVVLPSVSVMNTLTLASAGTGHEHATHPFSPSQHIPICSMCRAARLPTPRHELTLPLLLPLQHQAAQLYTSLPPQVVPTTTVLCIVQHVLSKHKQGAPIDDRTRAWMDSVVSALGTFVGDPPRLPLSQEKAIEYCIRVLQYHGAPPARAPPV